MIELTREAVTALLDSDADGAQTVREDCDLTDYYALSVSQVETLVAHARDAGLLPEGVLVWAVADGDGITDGALITVTHEGRRYASHHQDFRDLTTDTEATGDDLAFAVLEAVALTVHHECSPPPSTPVPATPAGDPDTEVAEFYGACGVANCDGCLPRYDLDDNPIPETTP